MAEDAVIAGAVRLPIGKFNGLFSSLSATEMGSMVIRGV
jgi:acetyl-CoA acetyltransferase